ncbi:hypothetical protein H4R19_004988 [Coemansia spiralis]|nr:hypothetical protein H4R19_004988 [Coemansia spiralis]
MAETKHDSSDAAADVDSNTRDDVPQPAKRSTLVDKQRSHIDHLMRNIDKPIDTAPGAKRTAKLPPDVVLNVRGSSAGAGSSDFSIYRTLRRKENERLKLMEEEAAEDSAKERFEAEAALLKRRDEERTAKSRAKRQRRKAKGKPAPVQ